MQPVLQRDGWTKTWIDRVGGDRDEVSPALLSGRRPVFGLSPALFTRMSIARAVLIGDAFANGAGAGRGRDCVHQ
jgi:hypothetical protein